MFRIFIVFNINISSYFSNIAPAIVRLGDQNLARSDDGAKPVDYPVKSFIKHEHYNARTRENDIALIELNRTVIFDKTFIRPACLQQTEKISQTVVAVSKRRNTSERFNKLLI